MTLAELAKNVAVTFAAAITACNSGGEWQRALELLKDMTKAEVAKDARIWTSGTRACETGGRWQLALDFLKNVHTTAVISACD